MYEQANLTYVLFFTLQFIEPHEAGAMKIHVAENMINDLFGFGINRNYIEDTFDILGIEKNKKLWYNLDYKAATKNREITNYVMGLTPKLF